MRSARVGGLSDGRQLLIGFGLIFMVAAPFGVLLTLQDRDALLAFRQRAVAAEATVMNRSSRTQGYADSKGRARSRQVYEIQVAYDVRRSVPLKDLSRRLTTAGDAPVIATSDLNVSRFWYDRLTVGRVVPVTWVPDRPSDVRLAEQVVFRSSAAYAVGWWLGGFAVFCLGLGLAVLGWRGRPSTG